MYSPVRSRRFILVFGRTDTITFHSYFYYTPFQIILQQFFKFFHTFDYIHYQKSLPPNGKNTREAVFHTESSVCFCADIISFDV